MKIDPTYQFRGKHTSVTCKAAPIDHNLDPRELGQPVAEAIANAIERGIASNPERTADGLRRLFVKTGTLSRSLSAIASKNPGAYSIVAPAGYRVLDDPAMVERLRDAVPVIDRPLADPAVREAIVKTHRASVKPRR